MKKLLFLLALMIPTPLIASNYFDLQHYAVVQDTITMRNDWYFRGSFYIVKSTYVVSAASCPIVGGVRDDGTFIGTIDSSTYASNADTLDSHHWSDIVNVLVSSASYASNAGTATYSNNADNLDGYDYSHFVDTTSAQSINGLKTFTSLAVTSYSKHNSDIAAYFGTGLQYRIHYVAAQDALYFSQDGINADFRILGTSVVAIGSSGSINYATNQGDLYVQDVLEVDGYTYFGGVVTVNNTLKVDSGQTLKVNYIDANIGTSSIIISSATFIKSNETDTDFSIDSSSAIFYDQVVISSNSVTPSYATGQGDLYVNDAIEAYQMYVSTIHITGSPEHCAIYWDDDSQTLVFTSSITAPGVSGGSGGTPTIAEYVAGTASGTYSGSLTVFDLPFTYTNDGKSLYVFVDGILMRVVSDYAETDLNTVTFTTSCTTGSYVTFRTNIGSGWVGTATSDLNMSTYTITNVNKIVASTFSFTSNDYIAKTTSSRIGIVVGGGEVCYAMTGSFTLNGADINIDASKKIYLDAGGGTKDTYIVGSSGDYISIYAGGVLNWQHGSGANLTYLSILQGAAAGGALTVGNGTNWFNAVYAASYPAVCRKSLKKDIIYSYPEISTTTFTSADYDNLPQMAAYHYTNEESTSALHLGYILNDDSEEDFGNLPYVYENADGNNEVSDKSLIGYLMSLVQHLNKRLEVLENQ